MELSRIILKQNNLVLPNKRFNTVANKRGMNQPVRASVVSANFCVLRGSLTEALYYALKN